MPGFGGAPQLSLTINNRFSPPLKGGDGGGSLQASPLAGVVREVQGAKSPDGVLGVSPDFPLLSPYFPHPFPGYIMKHEEHPQRLWVCCCSFRTTGRFNPTWNPKNKRTKPLTHASHC